MSDNEKPNETRVSANDLLSALNRLHLDLNELKTLLKTQNGLLGAILKTSKGGQTQSVPQINPNQTGYPSMSSGGESHTPGALTGLDEPQWTGQKQAMTGVNPTPSTPLPAPNHNQPLPQRNFRV